MHLRMIPPSIPRKQQPSDALNCLECSEAHQHDDQNGCEQAVSPKRLKCALHVYPHPLRAAEPFADHGTENAVRSRDLRSSDDSREGCGNVQVPIPLLPPRSECCEQFAICRIHRSESLVGIDGDREEADEGDNERLREYAETKPYEDERRHRNERDGLRQNERWIEKVPRKSRCVHHHPGQETHRNGQEEAGGGLQGRCGNVRRKERCIGSAIAVILSHNHEKVPRQDPNDRTVSHRAVRNAP
jgi:hypothetical protein